MKKFIEWLQAFFNGEDIRGKIADRLVKINDVEAASVQEIKFNVDVPHWHDGHAANLEEFLRTHTGEVFIQHLKKYQIEMSEWAIEADAANRSQTAKGVKIAHENLLRMAKKQKVVKEVDPKTQEDFINRRMSRVGNGVNFSDFKS